MDSAKGIDKRLALLATAVGQAGELSVLNDPVLRATCASPVNTRQVNGPKFGRDPVLSDRVSVRTRLGSKLSVTNCLTKGPIESKQYISPLRGNGSFVPVSFGFDLRRKARGTMNKLLILIAGALLPVSVAHAEESDDASPEASSLTMRVHGDIEQHCQISTPKSVNLGDLQSPNVHADINVGFKCNTPFVLNIQADKGALTNVSSPNGDGPYAGALPYSMALSLPVRMPSNALISRTFTGANLKGGQQVSSQGGIATDGFTLSLVGGTPAGSAGLLAGDYGETITLTVSVI